MSLPPPFSRPKADNGCFGSSLANGLRTSVLVLLASGFCLTTTTAAVRMSGDEGGVSAGDEVEEVTRCICGNTDLQVEGNLEDNGLFVQCDNCLVWQHGYCVGLLTDSQMPETYHCELCRPDLHRVIQRARRPRMSKYLGVDNASSPPGAHDDVEEPDNGPRKRRSTMNSRDAAYDRQLEAALLLSAQQDGIAAEPPALSVSGRSSRSVHRQSPALSKRGRTPSPSPPRETSKQKRRKKGVPVKKEDSVKDESLAPKRRGKKKGTPTNAHNHGQAEYSEDGTPTANASLESRSRSGHSQMPAPILPYSAPNSRAASRESTPVTSLASAAPRKRGGARGGHKKNPTPSISRGNTTQSTTTTTTAMPSTPSGKLHALSEMRKRVSAILEYVGRVQEEMSSESAEWSAFVPEAEEEYQLVENKKRKPDSVWGYGYSEGGSVEMIEELTSNLLRWETEYS